MELDATRQILMCCGTAEEKSAVLPLECSIILPDYYPDVMKVLKYGAETALLPVVSGETGETVSGSTKVSVIYLSEEGRLCCCSQTQPFSHVFAGDSEVSAASASAETGEITCRAVNKRRIDVHGSLELCLREIRQSPEEAASEIAGDETVCLSGETENLTLCGEFYKNFTLEEKAELGYGKPPFGRLLRCRGFANISECRVAGDKIAVKGEYKLRVLWESEETEDSAPEIISSSFVFPVARLIEAPGVLETDTCEAFLSADFPEISPEENSLAVRVRIGVFARVYRKERHKYIRDAFSCAGESETETKNFCVMETAFPVSETAELGESFELPEEAENIIDLWAEITAQPKMNAEGKICFGIKFCALLSTAEGSAVYYEKTAERETEPLPGGGSAAFYDLRASIVDENFSMNRGKAAEINVAVFVDGTIYTCRNISAVTSCSLSTEENDEQGAPLVFCFAEKGESVWSLAKHYRTRPERICSENKIDGDFLGEKTVLIIPK